MRPGIGKTFLATLIISSGVILGVFGTSAFHRNLLSIAVSRALLQNSQARETYQSIENLSYARAAWQQAMLAAKLSEQAIAQDKLLAFLASDDIAALDLAHAAQPLNQMLASQAALLYPERAEAWFWLGEALNQSADKAPAISAYQKTVALDPVNGLTWCRLGNLLRGQSPARASEAYLQCCYHGDPGSNGCVNAGGIQEELGNLQAAIRYYRLSRWAESLRRADDLERQLTPAP